MAHMDREGQADVEAAWEDALLAMAEKVRRQRDMANARAIGKMIRESYEAEARNLVVNDPRPFVAPGASA